MKILIIHTSYQHKGGEDTVVAQERALLEKDHNVQVMILDNIAGVKGAFQFLFSIWNITSSRKIRKQITEQYQPDVIHLHNWHFAIGPLIIRTAKAANIPIVVTLHNYRLLCPSATLLISGELFTDSLKVSFPWKAIFKRGYRNSRLQTFWLAAITWFHRQIGTWEMVSKYIVLTDFAKDLFLNSSLGLGAQYYAVKPNFVESEVTNGEDTMYLQAERGKHFLFVGRLSEEKGIYTLLDALKNSNICLSIAGSGPLLGAVEEAISLNPNIRYLGSLNKAEVLIEMKNCTALIFPSVWYEGMPMTIIEAFSLGTSVIASNLGAMSSMIEHQYNGLHFLTGNPQALLEQVNNWSEMEFEQQELYRSRTRESFIQNYTPENNLSQLSAIYRDVCKLND